MSADRMIGRMDADGDGRISREEFTGRRRPLSYFDRDGDGYATRREVEAVMGQKSGHGVGAMPKGGDGGARNGAGLRLDGQVPLASVDEETRCAIGRGPACDIGLAVRRGLFETGLRPRFPDGLTCRAIDEGWAIDYSGKRPRQNYHGGIDMPAPYGEPIIAAAAGTVVGKYHDPRSYRGMEIVLRHSPEDTGLPLWIYTQYAHFNEMPSLRLGQRVRMGEELGATGNSGYQPPRFRMNRERRPALHFAVWFSASPNYVVTRKAVIPVDGQWMDPNALYRGKPPFDSHATKALPDGQKDVEIPVMSEDVAAVPADTKLVWPYRCSRD